MQPLRLLAAGAVVLFALTSLSLGTRPAVQARQAPGAIAAASVGGAFGGGDEVKPPARESRAIKQTVADLKTRLKLQDRVTLHFPDGSPLAEVLKTIREATADKNDFPDGLPIYVDPVSLQDADKTLDSPVAIDLKGIPLGTTLKLALSQLGLDFWVNPDGLVMVVGKDSDDLPIDLEADVATLRRELLLLRAEVRLLKTLVAPNAGMGVMGGSVGGVMHDQMGKGK